MSGSVPSIRNSKNGVVISHVEYLGDINPSADFSVTAFPINPGLPQTFPWLSQISEAFEQYEFQGLCFHFKSMSSSSVLSSGANTSLGTVILATEYNSVLPAFTSKAQMENHEFSESVKPSQSITHMIETKRSQSTLTRLYVRNQPPENDADIRLYDLGKFQIATQGMQNTISATVNNSIGELWVTYQIKFFKPKISDIGLAQTDFFYTPNLQTVDNSVDEATPFGFIKNPMAGSSNICSLESGHTVKFAKWLDTGYYRFSYEGFCNNGGSDHGLPIFSDLVNCKVVAYELGFTNPSTVSTFYAPTAGVVTSARYMANWVIKITGPTVSEQVAASFKLQWNFNWNSAGVANGFQMMVTKLTAQLADNFELI